MEALSRRTAPLLLGTALTTAGLLGAAWWRDVRRREDYAARLHRTTVDLLLNALTAGDPVTARHSRRVADLADALAASYGFSREEHATLRVAALLHDMGKIDDRFFQILHSCEPLTGEERQKIEQHPHQSAGILQPLEGIHPGIAAVVGAHHECWDGRGYPDGLEGEQIPLPARIISVADVFDALTQPRAYHEPLSVQEALAKIRASSSTRFDPSVVERVSDGEVMREWRRIVRRGRREESHPGSAPEEAFATSTRAAG
jgi:putative nucleotidyltransferase with HDIG domain